MPDVAGDAATLHLRAPEGGFVPSGGTITVLGEDPPLDGAFSGYRRLHVQWTATGLEPANWYTGDADLETYMAISYPSYTRTGYSYVFGDDGSTTTVQLNALVGSLEPPYYSDFHFVASADYILGSLASPLAGRAARLRLLATLGTVSGGLTVTVDAGPPPALHLLAPSGTASGGGTPNTLTVKIVNPTIDLQPGQLRTRITGGSPNTTIFIYIDGVQVRTVLLDERGRNINFTVPVAGLAAGVHQLGISTEHTAPDDGVAFTTTSDDTSGSNPPPSPPDPYLVVNRWTFQSFYRNPDGNFDTYLLPRNPETSEQVYGSPPVTDEPTIAGGHRVTWQGHPVPLQWTFTGRVLTVEEYDALVTWTRNNRRVYITDDFGERHLVAMESLDVPRTRDNVNYAWHHKYTIVASALSGPNIYQGPRNSLETLIFDPIF